MATTGSRRDTVTVDVFEARLAAMWFFAAFLAAGFLGACLSVSGALPMGPVLSVSAFPALITALLYPLLRRRFLVRFDAAGVTVVRPLGRRNVPWPDVAGFCFALSDGDSQSWQIRISRTATAPTSRLVHVLAEFAGSRVDERRTAVHGALFRQFALRGLGLVEDPWPEQWQRDHVARALGEAGRGEGIG